MFSLSLASLNNFDQSSQAFAPFSFVSDMTVFTICDLYVILI